MKILPFVNSEFFGDGKETQSWVASRRKPSYMVRA
jgi:hypothetical protein